MSKPLKYADQKKPMISKREKEIILIVYEGECSEYDYFQGIKEDYRMSNLHLKGPYPDPKTLVYEACKIIEKMPEVNKVYCVFDCDGRDTFGIALEGIKKYNQENNIQIIPITSNPCFEIWLLLHFEYSTKQYPVIRGKKNSQVLKKQVKELSSKCRDHCRDEYQIFKKRVSTAIVHAQKLSNYQESDRMRNPYTEVHLLVSDLIPKESVLKVKGS